MKKKFKFENVFYFLFGSFISKVGDKLHLLVMPWLIYDITKSSIKMGIMYTLETLPILLFSPIAGIIADRFTNKPLYILITFSQFLLLLLIPFISWFGELEIWHIYIIGFSLATLSTFSSVISQTIVPKIFNKDKLFSVNYYLQILDSSSLLIGSLIGGLLITLIGPNNTLLINSISFLIFAIFLLKVKVIYVASKSNLNNNPLKNFLPDLIEGFKYVISHPLILPLTLVTFILNIANASLMALQVFFARDELHLNSNELSLIFFGEGLFQIITLLFIKKIMNKFDTIKFMILNLSLSTIGIFLVAVSSNWITLLLALLIQAIPAILFNISNRTLRQTIVPKEILGRVNGVSLMLARLSLPISGLLSGFYVEKNDIRTLFIFLALISTVTIILFWIDIIRKIRSSRIDYNLINIKENS